MSTEAPPSLYARLHLRQGNFHLDMGMLLRRPGVVALYGPSGCGKSTFLRCLAGLEKRAEGKLQVGRHCLMDSSQDIFVPSHKRRVGLVFQDTRLFPHLDVEANLRFGIRHRPSGGAGPGFDQAVELFDLSPLLGRRPATLSGGEKQRVAIARSLLTEPRLLLLDEPLSAVDATRKAEILPYLERLFQQAMIPVVLVTHDWQDVLRLSSQVYIMEQGQLKHHGPTLKLQYRHGDARLNALDARVHGWKPEDRLLMLWIGEDLIRVPAQQPPAARRMRLLISPLEIAISRSPVTNSSILNVLRCRLSELEKMEDGRVLLTLEGAGWKLQAIITQASTRRLELEPGLELYALIKSVVVDHASL